MNQFLPRHCSTYTVMHPVEPSHTPRRLLTPNITEQQSYSVSTSHIRTCSSFSSSSSSSFSFLLPPSSFSLSPLLTHITLPHFHHSCQYYPTPARQQEVQADHAHPSGPWGVRPTRAHKPRKIALYFSW